MGLIGKRVLWVLEGNSIFEKRNGTVEIMIVKAILLNEFKTDFSTDRFDSPNGQFLAFHSFRNCNLYS